MDWLALLAVQGTLKSLLQHHSSKESILCCSTFFTVQLSHPHMTTRKTIALTRWTFVGKVMSLLFNMLSRLFYFQIPFFELELRPNKVYAGPCRNSEKYDAHQYRSHTHLKITVLPFSNRTTLVEPVAFSEPCQIPLRIKTPFASNSL